MSFLCCSLKPQIVCCVAFLAEREDLRRMQLTFRMQENQNAIVAPANRFQMNVMRKHNDQIKYWLNYCLFALWIVGVFGFNHLAATIFSFTSIFLGVRFLCRQFHAKCSVECRLNLTLFTCIFLAWDLVSESERETGPFSHDWRPTELQIDMGSYKSRDWVQSDGRTRYSVINQTVWNRKKFLWHFAF